MTIPQLHSFWSPINALAFYNLARPPKSGNCSPDVISSLLSNAEIQPQGQRTIDVLDSLIDSRKFNDAEATLGSCMSSNHSAYVNVKVTTCSYTTQLGM